MRTPMLPGIRLPRRSGLVRQYLATRVPPEDEGPILYGESVRLPLVRQMLELPEHMLYTLRHPWEEWFHGTSVDYLSPLIPNRSVDPSRLTGFTHGPGLYHSMSPRDASSYMRMHGLRGAIYRTRLLPGTRILDFRYPPDLVVANELRPHLPPRIAAILDRTLEEIPQRGEIAYALQLALEHSPEILDRMGIDAIVFYPGASEAPHMVLRNLHQGEEAARGLRLYPRPTTTADFTNWRTTPRGGPNVPLLTEALRLQSAQWQGEPAIPRSMQALFIDDPSEGPPIPWKLPRPLTRQWVENVLLPALLHPRIPPEKRVMVVGPDITLVPGRADYINLRQPYVGMLDVDASASDAIPLASNIPEFARVDRLGPQSSHVFFDPRFRQEAVSIFGSLADRRYFPIRYNDPYFVTRVTPKSNRFEAGRTTVYQHGVPPNPAVMELIDLFGNMYRGHDSDVPF